MLFVMSDDNHVILTNVYSSCSMRVCRPKEENSHPREAPTPLRWEFREPAQGTLAAEGDARTELCGVCVCCGLCREARSYFVCSRGGVVLYVDDRWIVRSCSEAAVCLPPCGADRRDGVCGSAALGAIASEGDRAPRRGGSDGGRSEVGPDDGGRSRSRRSRSWFSRLFLASGVNTLASMHLNFDITLDTKWSFPLLALLPGLRLVRRTPTYILKLTLKPRIRY